MQQTISEHIRGRVLGMVKSMLGLATPVGPILVGSLLAAHLSLAYLWWGTGSVILVLGDMGAIVNSKAGSQRVRTAVSTQREYRARGGE